MTIALPVSGTLRERAGPRGRTLHSESPPPATASGTSAHLSCIMTTVCLLRGIVARTGPGTGRYRREAQRAAALGSSLYDEEDVLMRRGGASNSAEPKRVWDAMAPLPVGGASSRPRYLLTLGLCAAKHSTAPLALDFRCSHSQQPALGRWSKT